MVFNPLFPLPSNANSMGAFGNRLFERSEFLLAANADE
jgi:hypothetical protein